MQALLPIIFITLLSIAFAIVLALANKKLKVWEDPRIEVVSELLPGANCGACGVPGCRAFAEKVVAQEFTPAKCSVGGPECAQTIAEYLGIEAGEEEKRVARLLCAGGRNVAPNQARYDGYSSCRAASTVTGGNKSCNYGCLGLADCQKVCKFDAITMSSDGLPIVDVEKCTACGDCVRICPKQLFVILPIGQKLIVQCKSILSGDEMLEMCRVACTGCGRCAMDAPEGLITMENNLPVIHEEFLELQTPKAIYRCPTGAIVWIEGQQFKEKLGQSVSHNMIPS